MPSKIRVLDEETINKIAAGEVIENPSSVVKELVDNSIDSDATEITIEIRAGGRELIRISDNGCGMSSDDAILSLERHATSKIKSVEDIQEIVSMGFRGEAIPSIAAISKFMLLTCNEKDSNQGSLVIVEGGRIKKTCNAARSRGTTIEVKSLFYNVPVRRKFQRSPSYDASEILKMLTKLSLANPQISFELIHNQKQLLSTKKDQNKSFCDQLNTRITELLGNEYRDQCCYIETVHEGIEVKGYIGLPSHTRHNRTGQYIFLNGRPVFSPLIHNAVRDGYSTTLPTNRHPLFVIHIKMEGSLVDINVHPQKKEVRIRQESTLRQAIIKAVDQALRHKAVVGTSPLNPSSLTVTPAFSCPTPSFLKETTEKPSTYIPYHFIEVEEKIEKTQEQPDFFVSETSDTYQATPKLISTLPGYILCEPFGDTLLQLIDQKAAHSRIIYEELKKKKQKSPIAVQQLLVPHTMEATKEEAALLLLHLETLNDFGIAIKEFGKQSFVIDAIPSSWGSLDIEKFCEEVLNNLEENGTAERKEEFKKHLAANAGQSSLSSKKKLSVCEATTLIEQLYKCDHPFQSPNGKKTVRTFERKDFEKFFL